MNLLTKLFKNKMKVEDIELAKGKVLLTYHSDNKDNSKIYRVVKVAKNVNYDSLGKEIKEGDIVICNSAYHYFVIDKKTYFLISPSAIDGYFKQV